MALRNGRDDSVRLRELTKSYGDVTAVRGIDITIAPGESVALLGPNGAGKTTAIDMLLGLAPRSWNSFDFRPFPLRRSEAGDRGRNAPDRTADRVLECA